MNNTPFNVKMQPLLTNHRVFMWLCICEVNANTSKFQKLRHIIFTAAVLLTMTSLLIAGVIFAVQHYSIDLKATSQALVPIDGVIGLNYMIIVAFTLRREISAMFDSLTKICEANKNEDSFRYLARANNTSEWMWQMYFKYVMYGSGVFVAIICGISTPIFWIIYRNPDFVAYSFRFYKIVLPWNQRTFLGYIGEICFSISVMQAYFIVNGAFMLLFISLCFYHQAFYRRLRHSLRKLDYRDKHRNDKQFLCDLIRFHNSVKSIFWQSAQLYSPFILVQLICYMVYLAQAILQLDLQLKHFDNGIIPMFITLSAGLSHLFVYCYFGKLATESFEKMFSSFYESKWYGLPVDLQKNFILMIENAQTPIFYHGFEMIVLNLETFTQLIKTTFSYYMMFKTVTTK